MLDIVKLRNELNEYYFANTQVVWREKKPLQEQFAELDRYAAAHPDLSALRLKTAQISILADRFTPVVFRHSPFPSEMGLKYAESYGNDGAGTWMRNRNFHLFSDLDPVGFRQYRESSKARVFESWSYPDFDHHVFPCTNVIENGLSFFYDKAVRLAAGTDDPSRKEFLDCAAECLLAVKKIAEKFAAAAAELLPEAKDDAEKFCLNRLAAAGDVPWRKPANFYEGLLAIWFLYEVTPSIEGIAMGVIGHPDRMLEQLYRADLEAGRIDRREAYELIAAFLCYLDSKEDFSRNLAELPIFGERCGTLILGGCRVDGSPVWNELSELFLDVHHDLGLVYPKLQVRFGKNTPRAQYDRVNREFLCGRNTIGIVSDETVVPVQCREGKRLEDVRNYVVGGCWEVTAEGCEHSAGANCYYNLAKAMNLAMLPDPALEADAGEHFAPATEAASFDEFYRIVMDNTVRSIRKMCAAIGTGGKITPEVLPAPFFSACMSDCLDNGRDYTVGGGRYNPHGLPLSGFATFLNSMLAIRHVCFETGRRTLAGIADAMRANWQGAEPLRRELIAAPRHFGDGNAETIAFAQKVLDTLADCTRDIEDERGGRFQPALYNYHWTILGDYAKGTGATPDGRLDGSYISQGVNPSRLTAADDLTTVFNTCRTLDLARFSAGSVLTVSLTRNGLNADLLAALEQAFLETGVEMLQLNCVNPEELRDAVEHPEAHQDLIVRLYGYSARFTKLAPQQQQEFISRQLY
mgnify:CR=1 FL=1